MWVVLLEAGAWPGAGRRAAGAGAWSPEAGDRGGMQATGVGCKMKERGGRRLRRDARGGRR